MLANQTALVDIAKQQSANAKDLFTLAEPGYNIAEQTYQELATGDPARLEQFSAPVAQQASQATAGAKKNILDTAPAGGERNLALEAADLGKAQAVTNAASGAYLGSPNALAALAGQGVGQSIQSASTGIQGYSAGSQTLGSLGGLQIQEQQVQAEEKGNMLGAAGSLGGGIAEGIGEAGSIAAFF